MPLSDTIKPESNPPLTMPRVIRAREMYAEGFTVARILAHCEMSLGTLYACLDGNPFVDQGEPLPVMPRRRQVLKTRRRALKTDTVSLVNRLTRTAERQVRDIETRLSARDQPPVERERDVRMLAHLTRALRDLQVLLQVLQKATPPASPTEPDSNRVGRSIDELRRELSGRLFGMAASAKPQSDETAS